MDDEALAAIDLAVEGDEQLLREALEALKPAEQLIASLIFGGTVRTRSIETHPSLEAVHAAITKLEERLLRE